MRGAIGQIEAFAVEVIDHLRPLMILLPSSVGSIGYQPIPVEARVVAEDLAAADALPSICVPRQMPRKGRIPGQRDIVSSRFLWID